MVFYQERWWYFMGELLFSGRVLSHLVQIAILTHFLCPNDKKKQASKLQEKSWWRKSPKLTLVVKRNMWMKHYLVVSNMFFFTPTWGKIPKLTNIFRMGWNHQPAHFFCYCILEVLAFCKCHNNTKYTWPSGKENNTAKGCKESMQDILGTKDDLTWFSNMNVPSNWWAMFQERHGSRMIDAIWRVSGWWFQRFFYFYPHLGKIPNLTCA